MGRMSFFVKFYEKARYAADFIEGQLFCKTVAEIKDIEEKHNSGRADKNEGTIALLQPGQGPLELDGLYLTNSCSGPVQIQRKWLDHVHLFCVYAADLGNLDLSCLSPEDIEKLRQQLLIREGAHKLGEHAVVVKDLPEFISRVKSAAKAKAYGVAHNSVGYYDPDSFHGSFRDVESLFWKQAQYSSQQEFRFAICTGEQSSSSMFLKIGDISAITLRFNTAELNSEKFLRGSLQLAEPLVKRSAAGLATETRSS